MDLDRVVWWSLLEGEVELVMALAQELAWGLAWQLVMSLG